MGGGVTFSASAAVEKEKAFTITAALHENKIVTVHYETAYWFCGFGTAQDSNNNDIKIGSIIPQEIDGFKILNLQNQGYYEFDKDSNDYSESYQYGYLEANRKCVLQIKGKEYRLTSYVDDVYRLPYSEIPDDLGIDDGEKIKVTYTLL